MKKAISILILFPVFCFGQWNQVGNSINGQSATDFCGYSTALSADGSIVAMGAHSSDAGGPSSGQVRVFGITNGTWTQIGNDINGETFGDQTGQAVSLSSDGSILAIGEPFNNDLGYTSGQVRVFRNVNNNWSQIGGDFYGNHASAAAGTSVDLSSDGSILAFGIPNTNVNGVFFAGIVRVYEQQNNNWVQKGGDINGDGSIIKFGQCVRLSDDGNIIAISQTGDPTQGNIGRVKIYQFVVDQWIQIGNTIFGTSPMDEFGWKTSLSSSGNIIAIGTYEKNEVKVFELQNDTWTQLGNTLVGENPGDAFGFSLSLSSGGEKIAIGARFYSIDGFRRGRAYVFENIEGVWTQIDNSIVGTAPEDQNGFSVSISQDGTRVAVSATQNDDFQLNAGQIRVFENLNLSLHNTTINQVSFFPNPVRDIGTFSSENIVENIIIYNVIGQEIMRKNINSKLINIDLSKFSNGTYFAQLYSNGLAQTIKILKL